MLMRGLRPGLLKMKIPRAETTPMTMTMIFTADSGTRPSIATTAVMMPPRMRISQPQVLMFSLNPNLLV